MKNRTFVWSYVLFMYVFIKIKYINFRQFASIFALTPQN